MNGASLNARMMIVLVCLLAIDAATKLATYYYLPRQHKSFLVQGVGAIYPEYNPVKFDEMNSGLERMLEKYPSSALSRLVSLAGIVALVVLLKHTKGHPAIKWTAGILFLTVIGNVIGAAGLNTMTQYDHGPVVLLLRALAIGASALFFHYCKTAYFKTAYIFSMAGSGGNMISYFYPPYHAIDFIWSAKMHVVFNVADVYITLGILLLVVSPAYVVIKFLADLVRGKKPPGHAGATAFKERRVLRMTEEVDPN